MKKRTPPALKRIQRAKKLFKQQKLDDDARRTREREERECRADAVSNRSDFHVHADWLDLHEADCGA